MAVVNPHSDEDAYRALVRIVDERTAEDTGRVDLQQVTNDLKAWLIGHQSELVARAGSIALQMVRSFDRSRRPSVRRSVQLGLFHPHWLIPIAPNVRVQMGKATREDYIQWDAIAAGEHATVVTAYAKMAQFRADRLAVWTADEKYAIDVERRYFVYDDSLDEPLDDEDDEP